MSLSLIHVKTKPSTRRRVARARWNCESSTLECTIRLADEASDEPLLRDHLNAMLHIDHPARRAVLGSVDILIDEEDQPKSIEIYTNPLRWRLVPLRELPSAPEEASIELELSYDENGIATVDVPVSIEHDPVRSSLTFHFGLATAKWYTIAEGLLIGLDHADMLGEIRCEHVDVEGVPQPMGIDQF